MTLHSKETAKANQEGKRINGDVQSNSYNQYQRMRATSTISTIDPKIEKTRDLFQMFH
jgi:hypothetical protein